MIGRALLLRDISDERRVHLELSAEVARRLASLATRIETPARLPPLTRREADVLAHLARGLSNAAIGVELGVSVHTVGSHVKKLYAKLGVKSRAAAAALAAGLGPAARPQACSSADSMSRTRSRQYSTPTE
ncbi:MAG: LuxR C-terminal-related transcriptional regulator [Acidobacteriota bacterium]